MLRFIVRRLLRGAVALLAFQTLLFALIHMVPGDFANIAGGDRAGRAFLRRYYGLDQPMLEQYGRWLLNFVRFDFGTSFVYARTPVQEILMARAPRTLLLFLTAALLAYLLGLWLGKMIAWRRGGWVEAGVTLGGVMGYTSFAPWLAFLIINLFAWYLNWFPYEKLVDFNVWVNAPVSVDWLLARMVLSAGLLFGALYVAVLSTRRVRSLRTRIGIRGAVLGIGLLVGWVWWSGSGVDYLALDVARHLVLPIGTVVLLSFGETMMIMRTSMLETLSEDYVTTARAKGITDQAVRDRHVARNAILPVITRLALNLPIVLVGSLIIERIFLWRGMGQVIFDAIEFQDIPILLGILSFVGVIALGAHILLDIVYMLLDPRVRRVEGA